MINTWVFGATGSIGTVLCKALLERGDNVVAFTSSGVSSVDLPIDDANTGRFIPQDCDLSSFESLEKLLILSKNPSFIPTHVIFLARGKVPVDSLSDDFAWGELAIQDLMISLLSPMRFTMKLISEKNTVLQTVTLVSSQYAFVAQDPKIYSNPELFVSSIYSAVRGGIISGARSLGVLAIKNGIRVNSLVLGGIKETASLDLQASIENRLPSGSMVTTRSACEWLLFLASDRSFGAIGSPIIVDNGWTSI